MVVMTIMMMMNWYGDGVNTNGAGDEDADGDDNGTLMMVTRGMASNRSFASFSRQFKQFQAPDKLLDQCTGSTAQHFATSTKPHMTKSLLKWKKRKRKSKAQQQKEMENLQRDLVKLLTKRAIQVVKNKSLLGAHREVVSCHAFSHVGLHNYESSCGIVGGSLSHMDIDMAGQPWNRLEHNSDYVAQTVEAQLKLNKNTSTEGTFDAVKLKNLTVMKNMFPLDQAKNNSIEENVKEYPSPASDKSFSLVNSKPITYSELFPAYLPRIRKDSENSGGDFLLSLESFTSELMASKNETSLNDRPDWESDSFPQDKALEHHSHLQSSSHCSRHLSVGSDFKAGVLPSIKLEEKPKPKEEKLQNDLSPPGHPLSALKHADSEIGSKYTALNQNRTIGPSVFVHDPIDASHHKHLQEPEYGHSIPKSKRRQATASKMKISKDTDASATEVLLLEDSPENISVNQELREMLDKSFVEASCFTGIELLAVRNLQYHATKSKLTSVHVFNMLIHALAKKRDLQTIKSLFLLLRQQGLEPTLQTYAACLECMGRMPELDVRLCQNLLEDVKKSSLNLADIAKKCSFKSDEWDHVLKAIHSVEPDFIPKPIQYSIKYDNKLLHGLNTMNEKAIECNQYAVKMSHAEMMHRAKLQLDLEVRGEVKVKSIAAADLRETLKPKMRELRNNLLAEWRRSLLESFDKKIAMCEKNAQDNINMTLYPFLKLFPREDYVNIIFKCLKDLLTVSAGYSPTMAMIKNDLGWAVNRKYNTALRVSGGMDRKVMAIYEQYMVDFLDEDKRLDSHRLMWMRAMEGNYDSFNMDMSLKRWPGHITREMGKFLLDMILYDLKVDANTFKKRAPKRLVPAFCSMVMSDKSKFTTAELKLHPVISRLFSVDDSEFFSFTPCVVPMLVPPVPWISRNTGSLLLGSSALVRMRPSTGHVDPLKSVKERRYSAVLDSLNILSACAWTINKPILDLQIEVFNNKGDAKLKVPPPASQFPPLPVVKQDLTPKEKAQLYKERLVLQQQRQDAHGLWCTDLYRLSIANKV
ncbi:DNA-directed RNA polymerase [Plakobranchus ocellatus]|uniref:DNA-directed RNA polymerase n=1 Tax=Plakobranchus ocellatus TaxID=259542 RepID=A0AAV4AEE9_9GAST|nr:DNA-directed RNA polymerase [Plakobranchus ocellatus]